MPIVVAMNKIDKPEANVERVKQELVAEQVVPEEYGGDSPFVAGVGQDRRRASTRCSSRCCCRPRCWSCKAPTDAHGQGPGHRSAARQGPRPGRDRAGAVAARSSAATSCWPAPSYGRVRAMLDEDGKPITEAGPSIPVEIQGLTEVPQAGDEFMVLGRRAPCARDRDLPPGQVPRRQAGQAARPRSSRTCSRPDGRGREQTLPLIVKADVQGSQEALAQSLLEAVDRRGQGADRARRRSAASARATSTSRSRRRP